jgi:tetratricopeptide (TPR) repeat protein
MRKPLFLASAACASLLLACDASVDDLVSRGDELLFEAQYDAAARQYEAAVLEAGEVEDGEVAELRSIALTKLGEVRHLYLQDVQGALRAYRAVVDRAPGSEHAFHARVSIVRLLHDRLQDATGASRELAALIEAFPTRREVPALRMELANVAFRAGRMKLAVQQADRVLGAKDDTLAKDAALLLATIHRIEGRTEAALALYEGVLLRELDPETATRTRLDAAHCLEILSRLDEAMAMYESAKQTGIDRDLIAARMTRVRARLDSTRPTRASDTSIRP